MYTPICCAVRTLSDIFFFLFSCFIGLPMKVNVSLVVFGIGAYSILSLSL